MFRSLPLVKTVLHSAEARHQGIHPRDAQPFADTISHTPLSHNQSLTRRSASASGGTIRAFVGLSRSPFSSCAVPVSHCFHTVHSKTPLVILHIGFFALLLSSPEEKNKLVLQFQERPLRGKSPS